MLVKILTELRAEGDDRGLGRRHVRPQGGLRATTRPQRTLAARPAREQWPHLEPLVEAFGYRNVHVEGYEADDVIATLAERAKSAGHRR